MLDRIISDIGLLPSNPWFAYLWPVVISILTVIISNKLYPILHKSAHLYNLQNSLPELLLTTPAVQKINASKCFFAELVVPLQPEGQGMQSAHYEFTEYTVSGNHQGANLVAFRIKNDAEKGISFNAFSDPKNGNISLDSFPHRSLDRGSEIVIIFQSKDVPSEVIFECDGVIFYYAVYQYKTHIGSYIKASVYHA